MNRFEKFLLAAFALNVVDAIITLYVFQRYPGAIEINFLMDGLLSYPLVFVATKTAIMGAIAGALLRHHKKKPRRATAIATFAIAVFASVSLWNLVAIAAHDYVEQVEIETGRPITHGEDCARR